MKFSTGLETEYPAPLCKQLALAFLDRMQLQGKRLFSTSMHSDQYQKIGAGTQPRGGKSPLLVGNFSVTSATTPPTSVADDVGYPFQGIPVGAKHFFAKHIKPYLVLQNIRVSRLLCLHSFDDTFPACVSFSPAALPCLFACLAGAAFLWQVILHLLFGNLVKL